MSPPGGSHPSTPFFDLVGGRSRRRHLSGINVLTGDLSCVGPRPVIKAHHGCYGIETSPYLRAAARPAGNGREGSPVMRRDEVAALDSAYVRNWSMRSDKSILFKTIPVLMRTQNANQKSQ